MASVNSPAVAIPSFTGLKAGATPAKVSATAKVQPLQSQGSASRPRSKILVLLLPQLLQAQFLPAMPWPLKSSLVVMMGLGFCSQRIQRKFWREDCLQEQCWLPTQCYLRWGRNSQWRRRLQNLYVWWRPTQRPRRDLRCYLNWERKLQFLLLSSPGCWYGWKSDS